jgi:hypothetical protein
VSDFDEYGRREPDYDEMVEYWQEFKRKAWLSHCHCGSDLPGTCPGPANCPMCAEDDESEEEEPSLCECDLQPDEEEEASNVCKACGKVIDP